MVLSGFGCTRPGKWNMGPRLDVVIGEGVWREGPRRLTGIDPGEGCADSALGERLNAVWVS